MDIASYLDRIQYSKPVRVDRETLSALQLAHLYAVPFENLDIMLGRPIRLDLESLWDKIVLRKRGGFCYELNGLFAWLLQQIGYTVTHLNGRHYRDAEHRFNIEFDHLALLVTAPSDPTRWLVDVGYGETFTQPLDLDARGDQVRGGYRYRLEPFRGGLQLWQRSPDGALERQYHFDLTPRSFPSDYEAGSLYHQTSPASTFTHQRLISRLTPQGRITISGNELVTTTRGVQSRVLLKDEEEFNRCLWEHFGVRL